MNLGLFLPVLHEDVEDGEDEVDDEVEDDEDDEAGDIAAHVDAAHLGQVASQEDARQGCIEDNGFSTFLVPRSLPGLILSLEYFTQNLLRVTFLRRKRDCFYYKRDTSLMHAKD